MSNGSATWTTQDETDRLRRLALNKPLALLAAYNGTQVRSRWGNLHEATIKDLARKLCVGAMIEDTALAGQIPDYWPYTKSLAKEIGQ